MSQTINDSQLYLHVLSDPISCSEDAYTHDGLDVELPAASSGVVSGVKFREP